MSSYVKDPNSVLDYGFDWTAWLTGGETVTTATWTVSTGITKDSDAITGGVRTIVWLSGGTSGTSYKLTCRIVTSQGRTDERSLTVQARER